MWGAGRARGRTGAGGCARVCAPAHVWGSGLDTPHTSQLLISLGFHTSRDTPQMPHIPLQNEQIAASCAARPVGFGG